MTSDLYEILDAESIDKVVVIGHDWGSFLAARFYLFHQARVVGIVLLNVAYSPPTPNGPPFDLEAMLEMTEKNIGRPLFAYWQHAERWVRGSTMLVPRHDGKPPLRSGEGHPDRN